MRVPPGVASGSVAFIVADEWRALNRGPGGVQLGQQRASSSRDIGCEQCEEW